LKPSVCSGTRSSVPTALDMAACGDSLAPWVYVKEWEPG
jgi:hypothetical protein